MDFLLTFPHFLFAIVVGAASHSDGWIEVEEARIALQLVADEDDMTFVLWNGERRKVISLRELDKYNDLEDEVFVEAIVEVATSFYGQRKLEQLAVKGLEELTASSWFELPDGLETDKIESVYWYARGNEGPRLSL